MKSEDKPRLDDAWWAERAKRFLHPVQVEIIEILQRADQTQSVRDLGRVLTDVEAPKLDHFVGRLRQLGALELVVGQTGVGFMDVKYRLVADQSSEADGTPVANQFGKNLAAHRRRARISRKDLSFRASLSEGKISSLEEGKREPSLGEVVRLAAALSVSISDLLGGVEWKPDGHGGGRFELRDVGDASAA
jgi:DNA-binding XRE family transcriptional regulator